MDICYNNMAWNLNLICLKTKVIHLVDIKEAAGDLRHNPNHFRHCVTDDGCVNDCQLWLWIYWWLVLLKKSLNFLFPKHGKTNILNTKIYNENFWIGSDPPTTTTNTIWKLSKRSLKYVCMVVPNMNSIHMKYWIFMAVVSFKTASNVVMIED